MSETNKPIDKTYLQKLKEKEAALKARIQLIENKEKEQKRKSETRLKILIGAFMMDEVKKQNADENKTLKEKMMKYFSKERDQHLVKSYFEGI